MLAWIKQHKKIVAAIVAGLAAGAGALGYACPEPLARLWALMLEGL
ncbi:hypothetical protein Deba_0933 [Desulfarculus baarsii DSM 2075]|uniref:Uncharacterized protein n=1 Tax=Desulfarculus baarsii (strain ATCC 33931 / DSM 2075 / LMG 7858 / VKM B-1802 / 2st14) TaxID=644282 RepID=E1QFG7_DESB2|nr:hypothetical protein [Desulfarculus baarsii]ADK84303.1 hypothetical protein Deba_0933 [Desulfarculus baarsii DSM 2075]